MKIEKRNEAKPGDVVIYSSTLYMVVHWTSIPDAVEGFIYLANLENGELMALNGNGAALLRVNNATLAYD